MSDGAPKLATEKVFARSATSATANTTTGSTTDVADNVTSDAASATDSSPRVGRAASAGGLLRQAREQRGLGIEALAAMLKVPQAKLEALEADRLEDLLDITFARALAKAMCRVLKLDAEPVLALLPRGSEPVLNVSRGLNQAYRDRGGPDEGLSLATFLRPVVWGPILLLLGAALVYNLPASWLAGRSSFQAPSNLPLGSSSTGMGAVTVQPLILSLPSEESPAATVAEPTASAAAASSPPTAMPAPTLAPVPLAGPAVLGQSLPGAASAVGVAGGAVPLNVKAKAESWVEIVDARGQSLMSKHLRAGDSIDMTGQPPFKVIVGNVTDTELTVRGSLIDLLAQAKGNVARFELK
jgi:cytoskeleton protein RodZ